MKWLFVSATLFSAAMIIACDGSGGGTGGQGGTGGDNTGGGGGSGGSSGAQCGGIAGTVCPANEYCDFDDNTCGVADGIGVCKLRPEACPEIYQPTCGCDGTVYSNSCDANGNGQDVSDMGGCTPPDPSLFGCGSMFCNAGTQYCQRAVSDVGGTPDSYTCVDLPVGCMGAVSCQCLANEPCGNMCEQLPDGNLKVTCPGG